MDLFEKCAHVGPVQDLMDSGFHAYYRVVESSMDAEVVVDGRPMIMLGSNNYLGLANHPRVKAAAIRAVEEYGAGTGGTRCLCGTGALHSELEKRLARFFGRDDAIFYTSGYLTNVGVIWGLTGKGDIIVVDRKAHASILDATRLSEAEVRRFRHNDVKDLERVLQGAGDAPKLVAIDGVYSMDGDIAPLPRIVDLCRKYNARLVVDDAHGLGVLGRNGRGTAEHFGLEREVDVIVGTTSKALPGVGGFAVADKAVVHYLKYTNRPFIFASSQPPAAVAAIREALAMVDEEPAMRNALWSHTRRVLRALRAMGFDLGATQTPIVPITVGSVERTFEMWKALTEEGIWVNAVLPPAVPTGSCIIRMTLTANLTTAHVDRVLDALERIGTRLGVIPQRGAVKQAS